MKMKKNILGVAVTFVTLGVLTTGAFAQATQNIVQLAQATDNLSTLVTAVTEAKLVDTLSDADAEFTVFAPTNDAFGALPAGTLDSLLAQDSKKDLTDILTYHVVDSKVLSSQLSDGQKVKTLNGQELVVSIDGDTVSINGAKVLTADVEATNGVVHIIDSVLLPKADAEQHSLADTGIINTRIASLMAISVLFGLPGLGIVSYNLLKK
jgi:uncharacterized surface protein with fasciclin (FAS1) repeats